MEEKKLKKKMPLVVKILLVLVVVVGVLVYAISSILFPKVDYNTGIQWDKLESENVTLRYPVFDGETVWENATVVIENGVISDKTVLGEGDVDSNYFLMPGLIDSHTHISETGQMELMVSKGVTTTCDVAITQEVQDSFEYLNVWTARSGAFVSVEDGSAFVEDMIAQDAQYIKVVVDLPEIMGGGVMEFSELEDIVETAHANNLKVAVHAISISGVQTAVDAGVDMLIHIPIGEEFPQKLAEQIAKQGIEVMPTMVMMKAFADSPIYGYEAEDYQDAVDAVQLLNSLDVPILVATDANIGGFVPAVVHGTDFHKEMQLLVEAGLTPLEVLQGATGEAADAFGIENAGRIAPGQPATMVLVEGRPDQNITDSLNIVQIWVNGKPILENIEEGEYYE